ncbi:MAG: hypothetical protein COT90_01385 [Candidatus Diapherotrites archaeon CG10_big_fil_rev_8_21_14_0_10_31_34]|nr:MAG: hypothetical protein COT90_01385 [Candidatus Diapherotrites archaeon CG10_big_fil_rev_8_21_14_0_10_31_34]
MLNKFLLILFTFLFLVSFTSAIKVVSPVEAEFTGNTIELGKISPGQSFELIIFDERFTDLEVKGQFSEWSEESVFEGKNISIKLNVPLDASLGTKKISFNAFNSVSGLTESFDVLIKVEKDLWSVNISDLDKEAKVNSQAEYFLTFSNESIGEQKISLSSDLPSFWFKEQSFTVKPKSILKESVFVNPKYYGRREFNFLFKSSFSGEEKKFNSKLSVESSLLSKYSAPLYGFPFFTLNLFPYFLVESFVGFFLE